MEETKPTQEKSSKLNLDLVLGVGVSFALLFGMVWVVSKAWKKGQQQ